MFQALSAGRTASDKRGDPGSQTRVVRPGEGEGFDRGSTKLLLRLSARSTHGTCTVFEVAGLGAEQREGPPSQHVHEDFAEVFYVLEGTVGAWCGEERFEGLGPGSVVYVPPGTPHTLLPAGPWRHLTFAIPGGLEERWWSGAGQAVSSSPARREGKGETT